MNQLKKISPDRLDPDALEIVRRLARAGYPVFLVGGCVRDLLLDRTPKDFDIATAATPQEIRALFRNCRIIGRRFRLAHIFFGKKIIETATFRANPRNDETVQDVDNPDLLVRQDNVFGTPEEDARRRDFTINGLFYDAVEDQVIDYVNGLADLEQGIIRSIGDADIRFQEDPVRMLRAIKFSARLGFALDEEIQRAIVHHRTRISECATARVVEEVLRLFRGGHAGRALDLLESFGFLDILFPKFSYFARKFPHSSLVQSKLLEEVGTQPAFSNGLVLAALTAPWTIDLTNPGRTGAPKQDWTQVLGERLVEIFSGLQVPRRDRDWARQLLQAQRYLFERNRWARRLVKMQERDWFAEALWLNDALRAAEWHGQAVFPAVSEQDPILQGRPARRRRRRRSFRRRRDAAPLIEESNSNEI